MNPFLVSYDKVSAVVVADSIGTARRTFQETQLQNYVGVDRRQIRVNQVPFLVVDKKILVPKVLKSAVTN